MGDFLQGCLILFEFDVSGSFIVVVKWFVGVNFDCLIVEIECFIEILLLECLISLVFYVFGGIFNIHLLWLLLFLFGRRRRRSTIISFLLVGLFLFLLFLWLWLAKFLFLELLGEVLNIVRT